MLRNYYESAKFFIGTADIMDRALTGAFAVRRDPSKGLHGMHTTTADQTWCPGSIGDLRARTVVERSFRAVVLLAVIAVFNLFDLAFTQSQLPRGNFAEANPLVGALAPSAAGMTAYKTVLFGAGAALLYRLRRRWKSEAGLWLLATFYAGLMVWWLAYLNVAERCLGDVAVVAPSVAY
jgi:hypothetical protein